jgi:hypothetical protein
MAGLELAKAFIRVTADASHVRTDINAARPGIESAIGSLVGAVQGKMAMMVGMFAAGFGIQKMLKSAMDYEDTVVSLKTMLGTMKETQETLALLTKYAAETPFEMPEILQAAKGLMTFGERGQEMMGTLKMLGDASSGTNTQFGLLALIFNQVRGVGKLLTQDFRQLSTRGILFMKDIADFYKVDPTKAQEMLSKGKITFDEFRKILKSLTEEGGRFYNMSIEKSKTLSGLWSTFKDDLGIIGRQLGDEILPYAKALLIAVKGIVETVLDWVIANKDVIETATRIVMSIVSITAAVVGLAIAISAAAKAMALFKALSGPAGWAQLAAGIAIAAATYHALDKAVDKMLEKVKMAGDRVAEARKSAEQEKAEQADAAYFEKEEQRMVSERNEAVELLKRYRKVAEEQYLIKRGFNEWERVVASIYRKLGYMPNYMRIIEPQLKALYENIQRDTAYNEGTKWADDMRFKIRAMKGDWDSATEGFLKAFENPEKPGEFKAGLEGIFPTLHSLLEEFREMEKLVKLRDFGKNITEQMKTPLEKAKEELEKLNELYAMGMAGEKGGISEETYIRRLKKIKEELSGGQITLLAPGRYDFADFGRQIQDAFLQRNDPARQALVEAEKQTNFLDLINGTLNRIEAKPVGLGP